MGRCRAHSWWQAAATKKERDGGALLGPTHSAVQGGKTLNDLQLPLCSHQRLERLRSAERKNTPGGGLRLGRRSPSPHPITPLVRVPRQQWRPDRWSSVRHARVLSAPDGPGLQPHVHFHSAHHVCNSSLSSTVSTRDRPGGAGAAPRDPLWVQAALMKPCYMAPPRPQTHITQSGSRRRVGKRCRPSVVVHTMLDNVRIAAASRSAFVRAVRNFRANAARAGVGGMGGFRRRHRR